MGKEYTMEKKYRKITSIDIGSTNSQIAQRYEESVDGKTWSPVGEKRDTEYLISTEGEQDHPTELILKEELTEEQQANIEWDEDEEVVFGIAAQKLHERYYNLPIRREFKKYFYYSQEEKESDSQKKEDYQKAVKYTELFLRCLKKRESKEQTYSPVEREDTYLTVPVRAEMNHREIMRDIAEKAGWKNVTIRDEAESVLFYAFSNEESTLFQKVSNLTCKDEDKVRVMIMDIGGSTTDMLLVETRPDGKGSFTLNRLAMWPAVGETNTLGGIEIDKKLYQWLLDEKYIKSEFAEESIERYGYAAFREFKEKTSSILKTGKDDGEIPELTTGKIMALSGNRKRGFSDKDYDVESKKINRKVYAEEIAREYMEKLQEAIRQLLSDASIKEEEIDFVILAGGGSKMYGVEEMLLGEFPIQNPLRFERIKKEKEALISLKKSPSAICALGNVMPALSIPYRKYSFVGYRLQLNVYIISAGMSAWDNFLKEPLNKFTREYCKEWTIVKEGEILPVEKKWDVKDQEIKIGADCVPVFVLKMYSANLEKQTFQRRWTFGTNRSLGKWMKDWFVGSSPTSLNAEISVKIDDELHITVSAHAKAKGYWGMLDSREQRTVNG